MNTHSNGDHCNGNELVTGAEIVCSAACAAAAECKADFLAARFFFCENGNGENSKFFTSDYSKAYIKS